MDASAFVATLTSGLAMGLTVMLLRLMRQERQRSEARVSTLVSLAGRPVTSVPSQPPVRLAPRRPAPPQPARPAQREPEARRATTLSAAEVEIFRDASVAWPAPAAAPELFEPSVPRTHNGLLYVGIGAIVMVSLIALGFRWAVPSSAVPTTETSASIGAAAAPVAQPLALVSLRHDQGPDGTLVISGVVRNPAGSIGREKLFAAASLVDAGGALVATARAPLDFTTLAPGEESPFVVRIAGANGVARYRIGFRDAAGASVAHIDRR